MLETQQEPLGGLRTPELSQLDNPIWSALSTRHEHLAVGGALARRYPADVGPLTGISEDSDAAYTSMRGLVSVREPVALFLQRAYRTRPGWALVRDGRLDQMIWLNATQQRSRALPASAVLRELTGADMAQMLALAEFTEPGPFRHRTNGLGRFWGVFEGDRLVAMAGQRLHMPGLREVSAVCTHPDARGRGYARAVMTEVINHIVAGREVPFLHVLAENAPAIRVYEALGFLRRRSFELAVLQAD